MRRVPRALPVLAAVLLALACTQSAVAATGQLSPVVAPSVRPDGFWMTARQAVDRAARTPTARRVVAAHPGATLAAHAPDLGLWVVTVQAHGRPVGAVEIEDRTGGELAVNPWSWPAVRGHMSPLKTRMHWMLGVLGLIFALLLVDRRRLRSWRTLDVAVFALGFWPAFVLYDHNHPLIAFPLAFVLASYLAVRLVLVGVRGPRPGRERWRPPALRALLVLLAGLMAWRVGYTLLAGHVNDVGYASMFGADSILHGYPLYAQDTNHLDTYGPINYLAYVPASVLFPMRAGWVHSGLFGAQLTTAVIDVATAGLLILLGRRLRGGREGLHLGVALATLFAACPWTFFPITLSTNDGLLALLLVATLLTLGSPAKRGLMLGLAVATKISPIALLPLVASGERPARSRAVVSALACLGLVALVVVLYLPAGGLGVVWHETLGFQFGRRAFQSIWGQHPGLAPLQSALKLGVVALAGALALRPRRRTTGQVAALAGAVIVGLQLVVQYWSFVYLAWLAPLVIVALVLRDDPAVLEPSADEVGQGGAQVRL